MSGRDRKVQNRTRCTSAPWTVNLAAVCTTSKDLKGEKLLPNVAGAQVVGTKMGEKLKAAGISAVVFDRGARRYHGAVKSFADAVRATGINF